MAGWDLRGKTALVTGGAKRLGRDIGLALGASGANVVVHYNASAREAETTCRDIAAAGVEAWAVQGDLARPSDAEELIAQALSVAGHLDILVNNASIFPSSTLHTVRPEALVENVNLHAYAPLALTRSFAAQGREGAVINMLDARMVDYDREHAAYHLSKRMLLGLTSMCALEFAPLVRVNAVAPGLILPPEGHGYDYLERLAPSNPLNTYGSPEDITAAVLFLLESRFVTGQVVYVDGGRHLKGRVYG